MPIRKCENNHEELWRIGSGPCMYKTYENAVKAYQAYLAQNPDEAENPISFDFDQTLTTPRMQELAKRYISQGKKVYIITERPESWKDKVYELADKLGIKRENIIFTTSKVDTLKRMNITTHYDNNIDTINKINQQTNTLAVKV